MKIIINNRHLEIKEKEVLYTGNVKTYIINVEYDDTYKDRQLIIYFKNNDIKKIEPVGPNNTITIPHEVLEKEGTLYVGFYSPKSKEEKIIDRYSSNLDTLRVMLGGYDEGADYAEELTPTIVEQYLQEMREFYNESFEEYNSNAKNKLESYNTNADNKLKEYNNNVDLKLTEYNNNSTQKIEEYNQNTKLKKEEIDAVAKEVIKNKEDIEEIEKRVSVSEKNAKASEANASISEQNAQKSAENASKSLNDVTSIQKEINQTKGEIDTAKTSIDNSVIEVNRAVTEATTQANISKAQAEISTSNASQTSTDKTAVENIKNEVSKIKTSVEKTKTDTEKIKTDTQAIYNDTVQAKNETLEAKTEVESSLENERNESDKRYARAIESEEIVVNGSGQVELDEEGFMKDFSAEGNLPDITQEIREGYNLLNILGLKEAGTVETKKNITYTVLKDGRIEVNGTSTEYVSFNLGTVELEPGTYYSSGNHSNIFIQGIGDFNFSNNQTFTLNERGKTILYLVVLENSGNIDKEIIAPMITANLTNKPYEQYGVSPSLDFPSSFENVVRNVDISNSQKNILPVDLFKDTFTLYGVTFVKTRYGYLINGTATNTGAAYIFGTNLQDTTQRWKLKEGTYTFQSTIEKLSLAFVYGGEYVFTKGTKTFSEEREISGLRFQFDAGASFNNEELIVQVAKEELPTNIEEYNGYNEQLLLLDNQFLGNFQGYKNYIENNKIKGGLKILTFNGTESFVKLSDGENYNEYRLILSQSCLNNVVSNYFNDISPNRLVISGNNKNELYIRIDKKYNLSTLELLKAFLKTKYAEGKPVQILCISSEEFEEDLSLENKSKINSLKVYKGINNFYSNCKIRFKANIDINNHIEKRLKEIVANERKISDSKYAIALKIQTEEAQNHQIYADNSKIDNLVIKGGQMTQKTREGYNLFNKDNFVGFNNYYLNISGIIEKANNNYIFILPIKPNTSYTIQKNISNRLRVGFIASDNLENLIGETVINFSIDDAGIQITASSSPESNYLMVQYAAGTDENLDELVNSIQVVEGTEAKQYEQHGSSPSLDHSSEAEVTARIVVDNKQINIVDPNELAIFNSNRYINTKNYTIVPTYYIEPNTEYAVISNIEFGDAGFWGWLNAKSTRLTTRKDSTYDKFVTLFNSGKNTRLSFYVGGFKTDTQGVYQTFTSLYDFFNKTEFMIVKSSFIKNGVLPEYQPHNGYSKEIILPEGQFNNSLGSNYNYIAKINGKWNLVSTIKKLDINYLKNMILGYQDKENFALIVSNLDNVNRDYFFATTPVLCNVLPTLKDVSNETSKEMISIYRHDNSNQLRINVSKTRLDVFEGTNYVDKFKAMLDDMIEKGLNFDIYYPLSEANYEYIELPEETQQVLNSIELMYDLNIISIYNGTMSFEYNKSLARAFEEEKENNAKLQAQIDEIMTLLSTPSTASMLAENLAADNESEVL